MTQRTRIIVISIVVVFLLLQLGGSFQMFRLQFKSPIAEKYVYFKKCSSNKNDCRYIRAQSVLESNYIEKLREYYIKGIYRKQESFGGTFELGEKVEILEYNKAKGIAFVRIYGTTPRLTKEKTGVVMMSCLHDTLPEELKTTQTPPVP
jgi:hypothetical protein